ncbi:hypothetical protein ON010_g4115 [Phytophthora cinnamomi]|nr:hypothetical protein ON010_g4115 [Phytophthora cinnamomi]
MPPTRSGSMVPPLRRARSASMSSLAQVDLHTLDTELVLDYARKVMHLQLQPATSSEKMQMLFALSQKLLNAFRWLLEERDQSTKRFEEELPNSTPVSRTDATIPSLHTQRLAPECVPSQPPKEPDKPSVDSRILASAVAPMPLTAEVATLSDVKSTPISTTPAQVEVTKDGSIRPAESATAPIKPSQTTRICSLRSVMENEPLTESVPTQAAFTALQVSQPQEGVLDPPPKPDALQVYLQVQRSVICLQKYSRGFMLILHSSSG